MGLAVWLVSDPRWAEDSFHAGFRRCRTGWCSNWLEQSYSSPIWHSIASRDLFI